MACVFQTLHSSALQRTPDHPAWHVYLLILCRASRDRGDWTAGAEPRTAEGSWRLWEGGDSRCCSRGTIDRCFLCSMRRIEDHDMIVLYLYTSYSATHLPSRYFVCAMWGAEEGRLQKSAGRHFSRCRRAAALRNHERTAKPSVGAEGKENAIMR